MNARRFALLLAAALLAALPAAATQKTPAQLSTQVQSNFADNKTGAITPKILRDTTQDIVDSFAPLSSLVIACPSSQWIQSIATGGVSTCAQIGFSNLSGSISPTQIPYPSLTSIGGVMAVNPVANQFVTSINTSGVPLLAQPSFSNLSGTIAASQLIAPGASTFGAVKSSSAGANQFATGINTSGVVTYAQPAFSNLSGSIAASQLIAPGASTLGGVKSSSAPSNQFATGIDTTGAVTYAQPTAANISGLSPYGSGATGTGVNATATTFSASNQSLWLVGTYTGSGTGPFAEISATDTANSGGSIFPNTALRIDHNLNAGAGAGNRNTLLPILTKNTAVAGTDATKKFYTPFFSQMYSTAGDGGSGGSPYGSYYGFSSIMQAQSGSTYLSSVAGGEIDVAVQTGASTDLKVGLLLASVNNDAVKGTSYDGFLAFGADSTTTAKWTYGITFGWPKGPWAFDTSSTLIGSVASTTSLVANYGVDLSGVTFSTGAFKSTGFLVGPSGATTVASLTSTGAGSFAGSLSSTGASAGIVAGSRSGSGNTYQWYNATGVGLQLYDGTSNILSIISTGGIYASGELVPALKTFAGLPTCNSSTRGAHMTISDGSAAISWGSNATGGSSTIYGVFCNGANWTVAAK